LNDSDSDSVSTLFKVLRVGAFDIIDNNGWLGNGGW
jgi:hypothetical protein